MKKYEILENFTEHNDEVNFVSEWEKRGWKFTGNFHVIEYYDIGTMANPLEKFPKTIQYEFVKNND